MNPVLFNFIQSFEDAIFPSFIAVVIEPVEFEILEDDLHIFTNTNYVISISSYKNYSQYITRRINKDFTLPINVDKTVSINRITEF